jgi:hypothetical protein
MVLVRRENKGEQKRNRAGRNINEQDNVMLLEYNLRAAMTFERKLRPGSKKQLFGDVNRHY